MKRREFVQLAQTYDPKKSDVRGWWWSEKLDGFRCWWDGGITRGKAKVDVPWANTDKDERLVDRQIATGLWSRYGNVIYAPDYWLDTLPDMSLDGELWSARGEGARQDLARITRRLDRDGDWSSVKLMVFAAPTLRTMLQDGEIKTTHYKKRFHNFYDFVTRDQSLGEPRDPFHEVYDDLCILKATGHLGAMVEVVEQTPIPYLSKPATQEYLDSVYARLLDQGAEGIMFRNPHSSYETRRTSMLLKWKPFDTMSCTVVGYTTGRSTALGSKLQGLMGALIVKDEAGHVFKVSGFTDAERYFSSQDCYNWAYNHPDETCPDWVSNDDFPVGKIVNIKYRELSKEGIPVDARYHRGTVI